MRTLFCSSEIYPFIKTGGLGDVTAALPPALIKAGVDVRLFLPGYSNLLKHLKYPETLIEFPVYFGATNVRIIRGVLPGNIITYVLDAPSFWDRSSAYVDNTGKDWADNHYRFAAFCRAATDLGDYDPDWHADIIHANDWQCGLMAPYIKLKGGNVPKTVITIHNIAYQGLFVPDVLPTIGLPAEMYTIEGAEFYNKIGYLKAGLAYSDHITTVSPTYAQEIQHTDQGCGLEGFLRTKANKITGILNGIDTDIWNPMIDRDVIQPFDIKHFAEREKNRQFLFDKYNLSNPDGPLFVAISRLGYQKGFDLLLESMPHLLERGGNLIVLGSGDKVLEDAFVKLSSDHKGQVAAHIGYDETLAHKLQAGADVIVMPSRSEPCGLVQLYALRYGALPFVRKTGGLADTVTDITQENPTGFVFEGDTSSSLSAKLDMIFETFKDKNLWQTMQKRAMAKDFSWDEPAKAYLSLYHSLLK